LYSTGVMVMVRGPMSHIQNGQSTTRLEVWIRWMRNS
jgi:hypothetical protein